MTERCTNCSMPMNRHHNADGVHECPNFRYQADAEFRFFLFDPQGDWEYFRTPEDRDKAASALIDNFLDETWDEEVENVLCGEISHTCQQTEYRERPPDDELIDGEDLDGIVWPPEWDYICQYGMVPLSDKGKRDD